MSTLSIAWKDLQILFKDRSNLISTFVLPVAFIIVFLGVAGGGGSEADEEENGDSNRISVPVVNLDQGGEMAGLLLDTLNGDGGLLSKTYPQAEAATARAAMSTKTHHLLLMQLPLARPSRAVSYS